MDSLDHLTAAIARAKVYGESELGSYYRQCMNAEERLRFDGMLVRTGDQLAYCAGTGESRFVARARAMLRNEQVQHPGLSA